MKKRKIHFLLLLLMTFSTASVFALNPSRTYKQLPDKYNMEYVEHKVKTNDGDATLNAWYFPCKSEKTTRLILIAHSGEGNMADYLRRVDQFRSEYNVVIFDYRGYGTSSEFEIDNNMFIYPHFQDDMETMIDFCRQQFVQTFYLYGWGNLGGGLTLGIGYNRPEIRKIIADTPFLSMEDLEGRFSSWDEPMEVPFAGYEKRFEPIYAMDAEPAKNLTSVLVILGSNDILFKPDDYEVFYKKQKKLMAKMYVVENPDRKDNFRMDKAAYFKTVSEFLAD